jgi:signal transduction histidine kinase
MNNPSDSLKQVESYAFTLAVLDSMEDMIVVVGGNGTVINANDAWKRFAQDHGASSPVTRAVGMKYEDLCWWAGGDHSADVPVIVEALKSVFDGRQSSFSIEYPFESFGRKRWFLLKISPLNIAGGVAIISHTDITGRRHAEGALRESEERYRRLVSIMPAAVYTCDAEGLITFFNQRAAEIWGREPRLRDPQDRYCGSFRLYRPNMRPLKYEQYPMAEAVLTGKYARDREILIERPDGKYLNASVNIDPLYNEHGQLAGAINVFRDITEQKQLWEENRRHQEKLEERIVERTKKLRALNKTLMSEIEERKRIEAELEEVRRRLMDRVETERLRIARELHDNTIQDLYGLIYYIASLRDPDKSGKEWDEESVNIIQELIRINETLRLTMSNLRPPTLSPFGLEKSIQEHAENIGRIHPDLTISLELDQDLQTLSEPARVSLFRIYQVAINNVIRHAEANKVDIRFYFEENQACLEIQDNGKGFQLPERWVEFARQGFLGLVGAFERAESAGGNLTVESELGMGALVRAVIPVV